MKSKRRLLVISICLGAILFIVLAFALPANRSLTNYVESPHFRAALEEETAKGLHFPSLKFAPIHRTGALSAASESATATKGRKALTSLDARKITGVFNPAGVLTRVWEISDLHVGRAEIGIHVYEPTPEPTPAKPWFALFLPDRVYLKHTWSDHADITWQTRGARAGIFDTKLVITPHGRDFNYAAHEGTLRNPPMPEMPLRETRLLITKELFQVYTLEVGSEKTGTVHASGSAATKGDDKNVHFKFEGQNLLLAKWLPESWANNVKGRAEGELQWTGPDFKLRVATMKGALRIRDGELTNLSFLDQLASIAAHPDLRTLHLTQCESQVTWKSKNIHLEKLLLEEKGKFRVEGNIRIEGKSLAGTLDLGLAPEYLTSWLPHPEEVFPRQSGGYLWTTIHLGGTIEKPDQDLSPRVMDSLKGSPLALLQVALRAWTASQSGD